MTTGVDSLHLGDSVALAGVLAARLAADSGGRALLIKGLAAAHHRLRPGHASMDADVWIEPGKVLVVTDGLGRIGWLPRPSSSVMDDVVDHSVALVHPAWPCDIDLHARWPGFLADDDTVFEALWRRREPLTVAGREVQIPDRTACVLVAATHAIRSPRQTRRHSLEYLYLIHDVLPRLNRQRKEELLELAVELRAVDTARPFLNHLGLALPAPVPHGVDLDLDAWRARVGAHGSTTAQLWIAVASRPWRERPATAWRALWPPEAEFRLDHPETEPGRASAIWGRLRRIARASRALPSVLEGRRLARLGHVADVFGHQEDAS